MSVHVDERIIPKGALQTLDWFASNDDLPPPDIYRVRATVGLGLLYPGAIRWTLSLLDPHMDPETRGLMQTFSCSFITNKGLAALISLEEQLSESSAPPPLAADQGRARRLDCEPGGFLLCGTKYPLPGKPGGVLRELIRSRSHICTFDELLETVWGNAAVEQGTVRSAVSTARKALRKAMRQHGIEQPDDPIPTVDRGGDLLAWKLLLS